MFSWLLVILLSYLFFGIASFGDKLILGGQANPKSYTFYVGVLGALVVVLWPFAHMTFPGPVSLFWIMLASLCYILGVYGMFSAIDEFEVSKVVPVVGALQPIFIFIFTQVFFGFQPMRATDFLAFILLIAGGTIISLQGPLKIGRRYFALVLGSALMFSFSYIFSKIVFMGQPFLSGMILVGSATALYSLILLLDKEFRRQVFARKARMDRKHTIMFFSFQSMGAIAGFLQNLAVALVPVGYLAIMNSLRGVQYVFLFIITLFFTVAAPKIFKEDISAKILIQKVLSLILIVAGLALVVI